MASGQGDHDETAGRLALSGVLGFVLLVPPLVSTADRGGQIFGVPVLWVYLLGSWALTIILVAYFSRRAE